MRFEKMSIDEKGFYFEQKEMFFGKIRDFGEIIDGLRSLELEINSEPNSCVHVMD